MIPNKCLKFFLSLFVVMAAVFIIMYGIFFVIITNQRLDNLEDQSFENDLHLSFMEQRTANCYPND